MGIMRTHVILSSETLKAIDTFVGPRGRSKFIEEAVEKELQRKKLTAIAKKAGGSLKNVPIPGWESPKAAAQWVHNSRRKDDRRLS